jgi:hypothetical protein
MLAAMRHGSRHHASLLLALAALVGLGCPADDADDGVASMESGNVPGSTGPESTATSAANGTMDPGGTSDSGVIMNACGTFDTNEPGDGGYPQDPDDPDIIAACTALCDAMTGVVDCTTDPAACLEACKLRSCQICSGTLVPLVTCETELFDATACTCDADGALCGTPEGCAEQLADTYQCGG